jgi:hypothetical protein
MMDSIVYIPLIVTAVFGVVFLLYSWIFVRFIKHNTFNGMDSNIVKQFINEQSFFIRVFMAYVWKCNTTGEQRTGLAKWFLIWQYINIISYIAIILVSWYEAICIGIFDKEINAGDYVIGTLTYGNLLDLIMSTIIATLPVSVVLSVPYALLSKKKLKDESGNE